MGGITKTWRNEHFVVTVQLNTTNIKALLVILMGRVVLSHRSSSVSPWGCRDVRSCPRDPLPWTARRHCGRSAAAAPPTWCRPSWQRCAAPAAAPCPWCHSPAGWPRPGCVPAAVPQPEGWNRPGGQETGAAQRSQTAPGSRAAPFAHTSSGSAFPAVFRLCAPSPGMWDRRHNILTLSNTFKRLFKHLKCFERSFTLLSSLFLSWVQAKDHSTASLLITSHLKMGHKAYFLHIFGKFTEHWTVSLWKIQREYVFEYLTSLQKGRVLNAFAAVPIPSYTWTVENITLFIFFGKRKPEKSLCLSFIVLALFPN